MRRVVQAGLICWGEFRGSSSSMRLTGLITIALRNMDLRKWLAKMKISENISPASFVWQLRVIRGIAAILFISAWMFSKYFFDLMACAGISLVASYLAAARRANFVLEVFDYGNHLTLKLNEDEIKVSLYDLKWARIQDGKEGLSWIMISLRRKIKFGNVINFYPRMINIPSGNLELWVANFNARIAAATMEM